jgi:branched-chain amino acid transport system substrate-binding protein
MYIPKRLLATSIAVVFSAFVAVGPTSAADEVDIAINIPLTGPVALFTVPYSNGMIMGLDEGAAAAGLPAGTFNVDNQDNAKETKLAASIVQKHFLKDVDVYVTGPSIISKAVAPLIDKKEIPHFLLSFDSYISSKNHFRLRVLPHYKIEGPLTTKYVMARKAKRVAILELRNSSIFEKFGVLVVPDLEKAGIEVMREAFEFRTRDYSTLALKAAKFKPDLIIVNGFSFHLYPIVKALRTLGLVDNGNVLCGMDYVDLLHNDTPRNELKGVAFTTPVFELKDGAPDGAKAWIKKYEARFNQPPSFVGAYGYDVGRIVAAALKSSGKVTVESIRAQLPYNGIAGKIELDADGDLTSTLAVGLVAEDGSVETLMLQ